MATDELAVAWSVTKASAADSTILTMASAVLEQFANRHLLALTSAKLLSAGKAYHDSKFAILGWDTCDIKPVIDIGNLWKDGSRLGCLVQLPRSSLLPG